MEINNFSEKNILKDIYDKIKGILENTNNQINRTQYAKLSNINYYLATKRLETLVELKKLKTRRGKKFQGSGVIYFLPKIEDLNEQEIETFSLKKYKESPAMSLIFKKMWENPNHYKKITATRKRTARKKARDRIPNSKWIYLDKDLGDEIKEIKDLEKELVNEIEEIKDLGDEIEEIKDLGDEISGDNKNTIEILFDLTESGYNKETKLNNFFGIVKEILKKKKEIKLPMQLFELIFEFDFYRGAKHPISSNIVDNFRKYGFGVRKIRDEYLVKIY